MTNTSVVTEACGEIDVALGPRSMMTLNTTRIARRTTKARGCSGETMVAREETTRMVYGGAQFVKAPVMIGEIVANLSWIAEVRACEMLDEFYSQICCENKEILFL